MLGVNVGVDVVVDEEVEEREEREAGGCCVAGDADAKAEAEAETYVGDEGRDGSESAGEEAADEDDDEECRAPCSGVPPRRRGACALASMSSVGKGTAVNGIEEVRGRLWRSGDVGWRGSKCRAEKPVALLLQRGGLSARCANCVATTVRGELDPGG